MSLFIIIIIIITIIIIIIIISSSSITRRSFQCHWYFRQTSDSPQYISLHRR